MIECYADKETAKIAAGEISKRIPSMIQQSARDKMVLLDSIARIEDLWVFPSLKVKRFGKSWSIRINDQWRITFFWNANTTVATEVRIEDYH